MEPDVSWATSAAAGGAGEGYIPPVESYAIVGPEMAGENANLLSFLITEIAKNPICILHYGSSDEMHALLAGIAAPIKLAEIPKVDVPPDTPSTEDPTDDAEDILYGGIGAPKAKEPKIPYEERLKIEQKKAIDKLKTKELCENTVACLWDDSRKITKTDTVLISFSNTEELSPQLERLSKKKSFPFSMICGIIDKSFSNYIAKIASGEWGEGDDSAVRNVQSITRQPTARPDTMYHDMGSWYPSMLQQPFRCAFKPGLASVCSFEEFSVSIVGCISMMAWTICYFPCRTWYLRHGSRDLTVSEVFDVLMKNYMSTRYVEAKTR